MKFDIVVLTAANEAQAAGYRAQLDWRVKNGLLPDGTETLVISDPGGRRVGSLGATLNVLSVLSGKYGALDEKRIFICHSGGDSRRTPAYAAQGKVFTPVPLAGDKEQPLALFDLILKNAAALFGDCAASCGGFTLVASGDVLLTFGDNPEHGMIPLPLHGITGIAYYDSITQGARHGVYVPAAGSKIGEIAKVADFLQKPDEEAARKAGAVTDAGQEAVDTGLLCFSADVVRRLLGYAADGVLDDIIYGRCPSMDIYEEFAMAPLPSLSEEGYVRRFGAARGADTAHERRLRKLYKALHEVEFTVTVSAKCDFFHLGSSRELLAGLAEGTETAALYGFMNGSGATLPNAAGGLFAFNSALETTVECRGEALVEAVGTDGTARLVLEGDNILTGLPCEAEVAELRLPKGLGLVVLPVGEGKWAAVAYGLGDDFKTPFGDKTRKCLFLNNPVEDFIKAARIDPARLWNGDEKDGMWRARLWHCGELNTVVGEALDIASARVGDFGKDDAVRYSLAEIIPMVNHARLIAVRNEIRRKVNLARVATAVLSDFKWPEAPVPAAILPDQVVWVTAPVRLDFAGGWSDTPPICTDIGGTVLNAAITLNGFYPLQVMAKLNTRGCIRLTSIDLGESVDVFTSADIQEYKDPRDWSALAKAALVVAGIAPRDANADLGAWLGKLGGGLDLTFFSCVPKGSGLGTSSILGAAVLACLDRVTGRAFDHDNLIRRVLVLEQIMHTGGGWQDQVGGIFPGVKLCRTLPGGVQVPSVTKAAYPLSADADWTKRCLLYYTGQKRMARNILQNVVNSYLEGRENVVGVLDDLKENAENAMTFLNAGDLRAFTACLGKYWEHKKRIDPASTNPMIEEMLLSVREHTETAVLAGAGGGGFILFVAKSETDAADIRRILAERKISPLARFFDFAIDDRGLQVTVL